MTTSIATRPTTELTSTDVWSLMRDQASVLVKTGFLPSEVNTPEKAMAIMLKGRELGVPSMYALSNIAIVKGKPTCSAELMLALIFRDHGDSAVLIDETNGKVCRLRYKRRGWEQYQKHAFTLEEAQTAGLAGQDTWKKYPQALLRARCISSMARFAFPDSIGGMYTPEELGVAVFTTDGETFELGADVDRDGNAINMAPTPTVTIVEPTQVAAPEKVVAPMSPRERYVRLLSAARELGLEVVELPEGTLKSQALKWCQITEKLIADEVAARAAQAEPEVAF